MRVPRMAVRPGPGANRTRENEPPTTRANVSTASVLATPGTPSSSRWPLASSPTSIRSTSRSCPTITRLTSNTVRSSNCASLAGVFVPTSGSVTGQPPTRHGSPPHPMEPDHRCDLCEELGSLGTVQIMTDWTDETRARVREPRIWYVATTNADGSPHVTPMWVDLHDDLVLFNTTVGRVKEHNLRRDPRVCLSNADTGNPFDRVQIPRPAAPFVPPREPHPHEDGVGQT